VEIPLLRNGRPQDYLVTFLFMEDAMSKDPKILQQMLEGRGGASLMEWSTVSNVHTKMAALDNPEVVKQLQTLSAPQSATLMEWSTVSNVHTKAAAFDSPDVVKQLQTLSAPDGATLMDWSTISNVHTKAAAE
jgi:hypothetical protein